MRFAWRTSKCLYQNNNKKIQLIAHHPSCISLCKCSNKNYQGFPREVHPYAVPAERSNFHLPRYLQERVKQCQDEKNSLHAQMSKLKVSPQWWFSTRIFWGWGKKIQPRPCIIFLSGSPKLKESKVVEHQAGVDTEFGLCLVAKADQAVFERHWR